MMEEFGCPAVWSFNARPNVFYASSAERLSLWLTAARLIIMENQKASLHEAFT
ncbi:Hypothetical protein FKW44_005735 [Caligus rogercresseyi]|uniref:Uncharacterized protein n=1 Tax=Caligus rogercresseyi TaxID=217165 RepID=A0A7T8KCC0_CALRO|nr:Hypothetical protein FKW44_005735 [Caligus rogercresseyi]